LLLRHAMHLLPFLQGPPRFDVGLRPIALDRWLFPDDQAHWLAEKAHLIDSQRDAVFVASPASLSAQGEAAALIAHAGNVALSPHDAPLIAAARLVSDDLVIMEYVDGQWINSACCLCNPTFFSAHFAHGKSLEVLHGPVPDGDFGLAARVGRVFTNLATDTILERHNWTVQWSDARYTPDGTPLRDAAASADIAQANEHLFLRVERQTIRKLPQSGAVLFTIRIRLTKLADVLADAQHKAAFEKSWVDAPQNVRAYKKWGVLERHVSAVLGL
jgi:dimethylamine monooxygenase subunit A